MCPYCSSDTSNCTRAVGHTDRRLYGVNHCTSPRLARRFPNGEQRSGHCQAWVNDSAQLCAADVKVNFSFQGNAWRDWNTARILGREPWFRSHDQRRARRWEGHERLHYKPNRYYSDNMMRSQSCHVKVVTKLE